MSDGNRGSQNGDGGDYGSGSSVNATISVVVIVVAVFIILIVLLFFRKYFAKYIERKVQIRDSTRRHEQGSPSPRDQSGDFGFEPPFAQFVSLSSDLNQSPIPTYDNICSEQELLTPDNTEILETPSSTDDRLSDDDILAPPLSNDDRFPSQNPGIEVPQDGIHQHQHDSRTCTNTSSPQSPSRNCGMRDIVEPPTSSGDPYFNDDLQREQLYFGPPPPYTPPGVLAPPQEAYTASIMAPSYEESLDHTVA